MKKKIKFQVFELNDVGGYSPEGTNSWKLMKGVSVEDALIMNNKKTLYIEWETDIKGVKGNLVICSLLDKQKISEGIAKTVFKKFANNLIETADRFK